MIVNQDFANACEQMMKKGSSSFYHAFKHLPSPRREAVYIIYSFCRMIDDAVDEPEKSPYSLDELEDHFTHLDEAEGHFIWPALRFLFTHFPVTKEPFYTQFAGQRQDYVKTHYDTFDELEGYCYQVAGSVGEMLLPVLHDEPTQDVKQAGIALGKGMQIVNIIRDVGEDQSLNRRYIPRDLLDEHGYALYDFEQQIINEELVHVIEDLIARADAWFEEGLTAIETYPKDSALAIRLASAYYREIIEVVRERDYRVFDQRAVVNSDRKANLFLQVMNS
ncbi:phytoene/squalene synthase family protein [Alkalibacillus almallahensis]|uniref:phytoene/squalene synthase family protein n=1 Tax=Alkalibacillus almallahensis TaxID=1379154 RepID=UPI001ABADA4F|nr:phytoene/squalene synthase family protein [Alkalibacillus almallahensis]NIK11392.1 phytoene synthase [Alkalibacillus almallahensis]